MSEPESLSIPRLRKRIAQLAAEGRHVERDVAAWDLADRIARLGYAGFNPGRRAPERCVPRLRYPVIEAN
jgi:hypothetical protein